MIPPLRKPYFHYTSKNAIFPSAVPVGIPVLVASIASLLLGASPGGMVLIPPLRKPYFHYTSKNAIFWPKIGHRSADFAEILGIDKNHLNTSYVKILGYLGHFLAKYGHFWSFLAHFGLYNYIGKMPAEPHIA